MTTGADGRSSFSSPESSRTVPDFSLNPGPAIGTSQTSCLSWKVSVL